MSGFKPWWVALPILLSTLALSACGEVRKIDEMRSNTGEMNNTTKELLDTTGGMKDTTDGMRATTEGMAAQTGALLELTADRLVPRIEKMEQVTSELYDTLRQGDAANLRRSFMASVLETKTLQSRLAEAALFLMSFEFQLYGSGSQDAGQERRLVLYHQAMMELMLRLDEIAPENGKVWPDAMPKPEDRLSEQNRASVFNALAGALHKLNRKQMPDPQYGKPMSAYDLFIASLRMKPLIDRGQITLPSGDHYVKEVLSRPDRVLQLLQTRYNMFVYLLLGATTDLVERNKAIQMERMARGIDINLDSGNFGSARMDFVIEEVLQHAVQTRKDMIELGLRPELTRVTAMIAKRITLRPSAAQGLIPEKQRKAAALWEEYLGRAQQTPEGPLRRARF